MHRQETRTEGAPERAVSAQGSGASPLKEPSKGRLSIGIMGGTFDPIHHGHLVAASEVMDVFQLDRVIFVPTAMQPFKSGRRVTPAERRYLMTVVALTDLQKEYPNADFYFITGADALAQIVEWKEPDKLFELAHFIGVTRPGHVLEATNLPASSVSLMEVPAMAISSTDCRRRVEQGKPVWYLVHDGVVQYINKHGLYQA